MIFSEKGHVKLIGDWVEVIADATCVLNCVYHTLSDECDKEIANETLVYIGRRAVMTDEEANEELKTMIMDLAERYEP